MLEVKEYPMYSFWIHQNILEVGRVIIVHLKKEAVKKALSSDKFDILPSDFNRGRHQKNKHRFHNKSEK